MTTFKTTLIAALLLLVLPAAGRAQDLYDTTVLRSFNLTFHDDNWLQLLPQNWASQTLIGADLEVDGVVYPNVGVRARGNSSFFGLPSGSQKWSLKIHMDWKDDDQELYGFQNLNLDNGFRDPTFCREVVYNNFVAQFIPNPHANHVVVTLNGENWGVYINVQQPNRGMLSQYFSDTSGLRISCANNPNGPGLTYVGSNPNSYNGYEIQDTGGRDDPVGTLIALCNTITNEPLATWPNIDQVFAIDRTVAEKLNWEYFGPIFEAHRERHDPNAE